MSSKTWSEEAEERLKQLYVEEDIKDPNVLAEIFERGYRSIISKLVQLKIYEKPTLKETDKNQTVKIMLRELENILDIEIEGTNLNKKENLTKVITALKEKINNVS
jgi:hypothetical protein